MIMLSLELGGVINDNDIRLVILFGGWKYSFDEIYLEMLISIKFVLLRWQSEIGEKNGYRCSYILGVECGGVECYLGGERVQKIWR